MIVLNDDLIEDEMIHLDRGFLLGYGVFETLLVKDREPIFLIEHLERLDKGLKVLNINKTVVENDVLLAIEKLQIQSCALRISVSDGNVLFTKRPITYQLEDYEKGFSLKVSDITRNPQSHITYIKSFNYIDNGLEREKAINEGFKDALFLNGEGQVTETSTTNLFWIKDNALYTPSVACGLLEGVMRKWVIQKYAVTQGNFTLEQVVNGDGVFLTNSLLGIMKVSRIGAVAVEQHPMIQMLQKDYSDFLEASYERTD